MIKKILISLGVLVVLAAAGLFYLNHRNRTLSPEGTATINAKGVEATIYYSRPSVRGRVVFGPAGSDALQPWGEYWRLGANESTEIDLASDVLIGGQRLAAGRYKLYAVPGEYEFVIAVSKDVGTWGAAEPDYSLDVFRFTAPVVVPSEPTEQHTISLVETMRGVSLTVDFENVHLDIPIEKQ